MAMTEEEAAEVVTASEWQRVEGDPFLVWWLRLTQAAAAREQQPDEPRAEQTRR